MLSGIRLNQIDNPISDLKQTMLSKCDQFPNMGGVLTLSRKTLSDLIPCLNWILFKLLAMDREISDRYRIRRFRQIYPTGGHNYQVLR